MPPQNLSASNQSGASPEGAPDPSGRPAQAFASYLRSLVIATEELSFGTQEENNGIAHTLGWVAWEIRQLPISSPAGTAAKSTALALALEAFADHFQALAVAVQALATSDPHTLDQVKLLLQQAILPMEPPVFDEENSSSSAKSGDTHEVGLSDLLLTAAHTLESADAVEPSSQAYRLAQRIRDIIRSRQEVIAEAPREAIRQISSILVEAARDLNLIMDFPFGSTASHAGQQEHEVWFDPALPATPDKAWKITQAFKWGLVAGQLRPATALDYLDRLYLFSQVLGTPWDLQGVWLDSKGQPRIVTIQPYVEGVEATDEQIADYLEYLGFSSEDTSDLGIVWKHNELGVVVGDAYPDNFVVQHDGTVVPIDLSIAFYS